VSEPYVPIARQTTANTLLTALEVATEAAETNANNLQTAVTNSGTSKTTAENLLASKFEPLFLVGA